MSQRGADPRAVLKAIDQTPTESRPRDTTGHPPRCANGRPHRALHRKARESFDRLSAIVPRVLKAPDRHRVREVAVVASGRMMDHMVEGCCLLRRLERRRSTSALLGVQRPIDHGHDHAAWPMRSRDCARLTSGYQAQPTRAGLVAPDHGETDHDRVHIHKENNILFPAGIRAGKDQHGGLRSMPAPLGSDN